MCSLTRVHGIGPKTVFFWAPMMKWCLVLAGVKDLGRPADKLSVSQNFGELNRYPFGVCHAERSAYVALAATGFIWVRYSFVITPVNYSLAAVHPFGYLLEAICRSHLFPGQLLCWSYWLWTVGAYCSVRLIACSFLLMKVNMFLCRYSYRSNLKATTPATPAP